MPATRCRRRGPTPTRCEECARAHHLQAELLRDGPPRPWPRARCRRTTRARPRWSGMCHVPRPGLKRTPISPPEERLPEGAQLRQEQAFIFRPSGMSSLKSNKAPGWTGAVLGGDARGLMARRTSKVDEASNCRPFPEKSLRIAALWDAFMAKRTVRRRRASGRRALPPRCASAKPRRTRTPACPPAPAPRGQLPVKTCGRLHFPDDDDDAAKLTPWNLGWWSWWRWRCWWHR